ncbi:MAG: hypothetical protein FJ213_11460 [Ignavibacteria bacterium]|nr:hypothetical protein [Ignavibacteria bacterium]
MIKIQDDFKEFIGLLNKHRVEYLIVGGYAVAIHSRPKFTEDIDFFINRTKENAKKLLEVLDEFGFGELDISIEDLTNEFKMIQLGFAPLRIDIMNSISGIDFNTAFQNRAKIDIDEIKDVFFISLADLLKNKKSSSREKDKQDVKWILKYQKS